MNQHPPSTTGGCPDLSYLDVGPRGPEAVVLLHSLGADGRMWGEQAGAMSGRRRVLVPDSRGHGASGWDDAVPAAGDWPAAWVRDLDRVLDAAGVTRAVLVGVSLGGIQTIAYAAARPDRVSAIVVGDSFVELEPAAAEGRIRALAGQAREWGMAALADSYVADTFTVDPLPEGAEAVRKAIAGMDPEHYAAVCGGCFGVRIAGRLGAVRAPALVLWGERDAKTPLPLSERIAAGIAGAELGIVPAAGHLSNVENPAEFTWLVEDFLDRRGIRTGGS